MWVPFSCVRRCRLEMNPFFQERIECINSVNFVLTFISQYFIEHVSVILNFFCSSRERGIIFLEFVVKSTPSTWSGVLRFASYLYSHNVFSEKLIGTRRNRNLQNISDKYFNHFVLAHFQYDLAAWHNNYLEGSLSLVKTFF